MNAPKNPALSNDRIVATVATLAAMLEETTITLQSTESAALAAVNLGVEQAHSLDAQDQTIRNLEDDLQRAYMRCDDLARDLGEANRRAGDFTVKARATLFTMAVENPEGFNKAMAYMRSPEAAQERGNKIAQIKRVREASQYGLKEAKDFVECFYDFGVWYERTNDTLPPAPPAE